jgi:hypothetical protein
MTIPQISGIRKGMATMELNSIMMSKRPIPWMRSNISAARMTSTPNTTVAILPATRHSRSLACLRRMGL